MSCEVAEFVDIGLDNSAIRWMWLKPRQRGCHKGSHIGRSVEFTTISQQHNSFTNRPIICINTSILNSNV
ncbi:hypothetical protein HYALB_00007329 [Hymenoscyphus albidus]|uniref:Uncharacterized protein n=1 Tax=Hymenoscyphus albidus TaxID=595503 RepID=A0A9N9LGI8_9HELO|nr:hypothetical protein HYALB_00007329 [Hymenoscyphus albidus]